MIKKQQTQADFKEYIYSLNPDHYAFTAEMCRIMRDREWFERYIESAPILETLPMQSIEEFILSEIEFKNELAYIYERVHLPSTYLTEILDKLVKDKKIKKEMIPEKGWVYTRRRSR